MGSTTKSHHLASLEKHGFVVIPSLLTPEQLTTLRTASQEVTDLARSGNWPTVRTLPKQFPPWTISPGANPAANGIWGVQHLMNPSLPQNATFIKTYFSSAMLDVVKDLLQCSDDDLVMELFNLLVRPERDFDLRWHRDDIGPEVSPEEELKKLAEPAWHAQWNLALYEDESLILVPGSHARARTEEERKADPFEKHMSGQLVVKLNPGDAAFYNNNILHRGSYTASRERMTLHGSVGHMKGSKARARNVLQHGVRDWIEKCNLSVLEGEERKRAEAMRERLVKMGKESGYVGYSLDE